MLVLNEYDRLFAEADQNANVLCVINGYYLNNSTSVKTKLAHLYINNSKIRLFRSSPGANAVIENIMLSNNSGLATVNISIYLTTGNVENKLFSISLLAGGYAIIDQNGVKSYASDGTEFTDTGLVNTKAIQIQSPTALENITLFFTDKAIQIVEVHDVVQGTLPSLTWNVAFGVARDTVDSEIFIVDRVTTSTTGSSTTTFDDPTIPANNWVWFITSATSGIINDFNVTMKFI